jgi:hypothetical protein
MQISFSQQRQDVIEQRKIAIKLSNNHLSSWQKSVNWKREVAQ